jgi:hypothetical protein
MSLFGTLITDLNALIQVRKSWSDAHSLSYVWSMTAVTFYFFFQIVTAVEQVICAFLTLITAG